MCRAARAKAEVKALQRQLKELSSRTESTKKELGVLNELNRGLMNNQAVYKDKLSALEATDKEKDSTIAVRYSTCLLHASLFLLRQVQGSVCHSHLGCHRVGRLTPALPWVAKESVLWCLAGFKGTAEGPDGLPGSVADGWHK